MSAPHPLTRGTSPLAEAFRLHREAIQAIRARQAMLRLPQYDHHVRVHLTATKDRAMAKAARLQAARAIAGTDGGAATARPTRTVETIVAGVKLVEMQDANPLNAMGLSRLQVDVAEVLRTTWQDALPGLDMPGQYGSGAGHGGKRHLTADEECAAKRAWWDYCKAMDHVRFNAGHRIEAAVKAAVIEGERAHVAAVKDGLDCLAKYWRMR